MPITARAQRFWRGLVARGSLSSPAQQAIELQPIRDRRFWKSPARPALTEVAAAHAKNVTLLVQLVGSSSDF
jgi:hypothetical protein